MKRNLLFLLSAVIVAGAFVGGFYLYTFFYPKQYEKNEKGEYINVNAPEPDTFPITENTTFVVEYYYPEEKRTLTENLDHIPALLGCDLEEAKNYFANYMKHISVEEREAGLCSYEIISYHGQEIRLRKTFKQKENTGFLAKSFNGMVVILKSDGKTVYEYTQINIGTLPEELRDKIVEGLWMESEEELYSFLENYSS